MSQKIAARTMANMQVAADRLLAGRILRLRIACTILAAAVAALCVPVLPPLIQTIASAAQPASSPTPPPYTPPPARTLSAALSGHRIILNSPDTVMLYARAQIKDMKDIPVASLQWYFLYDQDPGGGATRVSIGPQSYFASEADGRGRLYSTPSSGSEYPILSLSSTCYPTKYETSCANVFKADYPNPSKLAIAAKDEKGIYVIGISEIPTPAEPCTDVLGSACRQ